MTSNSARPQDAEEDFFLPGAPRAAMDTPSTPPPAAVTAPGPPARPPRGAARPAHATLPDRSSSGSGDGALSSSDSMRSGSNKKISQADLAGAAAPVVAPPPAPVARWWPRINYELLSWLIFGTITVLAVVDRFTTNVWPRETYQIGAGNAGSDKTDGLKEGPWSVQLYDIVARVSGRYSIVALNLLMWVMQHATFQWAAESPLRHIIDFDNAAAANLRMHKWNGITLAVMTLLHVWSIVFPCILHGWSAMVVPGAWEWPASERGPKGFKDANTETETMSLQVDDVYRIIEMTLLLAVLLPLSLRWLARNWHAGIHLHGFIALAYWVDIVRRHTHPHSWIINVPGGLLLIFDRIAAWFWRRQKGVDYRRVTLSNDYMLLLWRAPCRSNTVGPKLFARLNHSSFVERRHVFTGFENRVGLRLSGCADWTLGVIVRIYRAPRVPQLGAIDAVSHTQRMAAGDDSKPPPLTVWGPYLGNMSEIVRERMQRPGHVVLVGGGSAVNYLVDALQWSHFGGGVAAARLTVLYSVRDAALLSWGVDAFAAALAGSVTDARAVAALTSSAGGLKACVSLLPAAERNGVEVQEGRLALAEVLPAGAAVFVQGSKGLQEATEKACKANGCWLHRGATYD